MGRDEDMQGNVVAISGGASGIGLATAQILHARGAAIAVGDIDPAALEKARSVIKGDDDRALFTRLDVSDRSSVESWISSIVQRFGRLDGAANCAGVIGKHHSTRTVRELEDDQWDLLMRVNLTGTMYCLRAQLRAIGGKEGEGSGGSVVCVSSVQGTMGFAKHAAYSASKHGVLGLVRSAAKEEGQRGVRVNAVAPGAIETPLFDKRNALEGVEPATIETPIHRFGTAEECGKLIAWLLSDESSFVTGATYAVDGGWAC